MGAGPPLQEQAERIAEVVLEGSMAAVMEGVKVEKEGVGGS